jgi:hypothetical protein
MIAGTGCGGENAGLNPIRLGPGQGDSQPGKARRDLSGRDAGIPGSSGVDYSRPPACRREERWITIGQAGATLLVLVVHTHIEIDAETVYIRIISARKPTRKERQQYEDG